MEIKVSVIVPVYNVAKYVRACLESLAHQTLKEIEIIVINDASPDSLDDEICREYAEKYKNIIYLKHEKNKGLGAARNTAMRQAKGAYLGFVDSDDFVEKEMFEMMYEKAVAGNFDIVQCSYRWISEKEREKVKMEDPVFCEEKGEQIVKPEKDLQDIGKFDISIGNKFIRRKILTDYEIEFLEGVLHEDLYFTFCTFFASKSVLLLPYHLYYYFYTNPVSIINSSRFEKRVTDVLFSLQEMRFFLEKNNASKECKRKYQKFCASMLFGYYFFAKENNETSFFKRELKKQVFFRKDKVLQLRFYVLVYLKRFGFYKFARSIYRIFLKPLLKRI